MGSKDDRLLGLFLATVLALTPGCSSHTHIDRNHDGYCDDCNAAMGSTSAGHSYFGNSGTRTFSSPDTSSGHISTASSPKGGIGSHSFGGGG